MPDLDSGREPEQSKAADGTNVESATSTPGQFTLARAFEGVGFTEPSMAAFTPGLAAAVTRMRTSAFTPGLFNSVSKMANSVIFTSGFAATMTQLRTPAFTPGLAAAMTQLRTPAFTPGLLDSVTKMANSVIFTSGFAAATTQLRNTGIFTTALVELLTQIQAEGIDSDSRFVHLNREQQRLLCGYFAYVIVWLLILQIMLAMLGESDTLGKIADIITVMTGISGHRLASIAKSAACRAFDQANPPPQ